jgi:hypothetical protein
MDSTLSLLLREPKDKYLLERLSAVTLYPFTGCAAAGVLFWILVPLMKNAPPAAMLPGVSVILIVSAAMLYMFFMTFYAWYEAGVEEKLVSNDDQPTLEINDQGISGSIALLEGPQRRRLARERNARFSLSWDQVLYIRFVTGRRSQWMLITANEPEGALYNVQREFFRNEQHIIDVLRAHDIEVTVADALH